MKNNKKGFTLAELLIVIAIIAILIAIAIPVFSAQLDNARLQADHANLRSAYAIVQTANVLGAEDKTVGSGWTYCTDGTFHAAADLTAGAGGVAPAATAVSIQSDKHTGNTAGGEASCKTCVVDCSTYGTSGSKKATITVTEKKTTGGAHEAWVLG